LIAADANGLVDPLAPLLAGALLNLSMHGSA